LHLPDYPHYYLFTGALLFKQFNSQIDPPVELIMITRDIIFIQSINEFEEKFEEK
jgi:hypothetical protein